jgi:hypothetical protein
MDRKKALRILGLNEKADPKEIKTRFKELANSAHSDKGGSDEEMSELLEARETALKAFSSSHSLVPIEVFEKALDKISKRTQLQRDVEIKAESLKTQILSRATNRLRKYRQVAAILGAVSVAALFLGKDLPKELLPTNEPIQIEQNMPKEKQDEITKRNVEIKYENALMTKMWLAMTFGIAIFAGIGAWSFTRRIDEIEHDLSEFDEHISLKTNLYSMLKNVLGEKLSNKWTLDDFKNGLIDWKAEKNEKWGYIAHIIGQDKFAYMVLLKSQQIGLLKVTESICDGALIEQYVLDMDVNPA